MLRARRYGRPGRWYPLRVLANGAVAALVLGLVLLGALFPVTVTGAPPVPRLRAASLVLPGLVASAPAEAVSSLRAAPVPLTVVAPPVSEEMLLTAIDGTEQQLSTLAQAQRAASVSVESGTVVAEPVRLSRFWRYEVQAGDNLTTIAARFGIDRKYILWNNIELIDNEDLLTVGDLLQIPSVEGILHDVRDGETLTEIVDLYDAEIEDVIEFEANGLSDPNQLREGSQVLVVGGRIVPRAAIGLRPASGDPFALPFIWPVRGTITSYFDDSHPLGIDIGVYYEPVLASESGTVICVCGNPEFSYGWYIDIQHEGGYETRYAHLSRFLVSRGDWVEQGDVIAISGNTGRSTGPHTHFELRRNGLVQNPLLFLP